MAENHSEEHHHEEQHIGIPGYLIVFGILVVGTVLTYTVALTNLDDHLFHGANTLVALLIAFIKMSCVMLFFFLFRWSEKLVWLSAVGSFFWLAIMFAFTMQDYFTRGSGVFGG